MVDVVRRLIHEVAACGKSAGDVADFVKGELSGSIALILLWKTVALQYSGYIADDPALPVGAGPKLREAEARAGFAFAGEELLHQPFFVVLERVELPAFRFDQLVQRAQELGDLLLFGW